MTQELTQRLLKILVCHDDPADRQLVRAYLQQITDREIVLLQAAHPEEIQGALDKGRVDLVLMDNQIPAKSGTQWLAEIAEKQLAPVVMLTGSETEETAAQAFPEGAVRYLAKSSLSQEGLMNTIDAALSKWAELRKAKADEEQLERLATIDAPTGLYNRRAILGKLNDLINSANRYREALSLIMLDIDHFKEINDRYGHLTGDDVLEEIASSVRHNVRDTDVVGRYGGEEFIILLPKTNLYSAWVVAERLRGIIHNTQMKGSVGNMFTVTISQGLADWEPPENASSLISRAEEALYRAKEKGRNRVQILLGPKLTNKI
ncbi:MAG: GGDEF domain-containing protein [Dehalococcoidia bacterium]